MTGAPGPGLARCGKQHECAPSVPALADVECRAPADMDTSGIPDALWLDADQLVDAAIRDFRRGVPVSVPDGR